MGAHQIKRTQGNFFCPRIKGAPFIRYFRVFTKSPNTRDLKWDLPSPRIFSNEPTLPPIYYSKSNKIFPKGIYCYLKWNIDMKYWAGHKETYRKICWTNLKIKCLTISQEFIEVELPEKTGFKNKNK